MTVEGNLRIPRDRELYILDHLAGIHLSDQKPLHPLRYPEKRFFRKREKGDRTKKTDLHSLGPGHSDGAFGHPGRTAESDDR